MINCVDSHEILLLIIFSIFAAVILYWNKKLSNEIKKRKAIEKKLEEKNVKSDELLNVLPVPILITDIETRKIVFANNYSEIQYKKSKKELIGRSITELYTNIDQGEEILNAMIYGIPLINYETRYKLLDGEEIDALLSLIPVEYNNKASRIGSITDVTEFKDTQKALIEEKDKAVKAERIKSDFLANMSHEIRTPLNAILGFVGILKEQESDEDKLKYLTIIDKSSQSLLEIINDILDFTKIEHGKIEIDNIDFNAIVELETVAELFKARCEEKDILYSLDINNSVPKYLNCDIQKLKQIILNLLSNAVKFTNHGKSIALNIRYDNSRLFISVADEGIGIPRDRQKTIFEAFSQADSSTTRKFGGTGLGLSISSAFVKILGGELELESEENIGSRFHFSIPVKNAKEIPKETNISTLYKLKGDVLVVEDNEANQMFMKVILKKMNLNFDIANDGVEAIKKFKENKYDVVLMDENMPNMNGIEATKQILEYEKQNNLMHTPIIALTANAIKGDREKFLSAGMDEYITKPIDKVKLFNIIKGFFK